MKERPLYQLAFVVMQKCLHFKMNRTIFGFWDHAYSYSSHVKTSPCPYKFWIHICPACVLLPGPWSIPYIALGPRMVITKFLYTIMMHTSKQKKKTSPNASAHKQKAEILNPSKTSVPGFHQLVPNKFVCFIMWCIQFPQASSTGRDVVSHSAAHGYGTPWPLESCSVWGLDGELDHLGSQKFFLFEKIRSQKLMGSSSTRQWFACVCTALISDGFVGGSRD